MWSSAAFPKPGASPSNFPSCRWEKRRALGADAASMRQRSNRVSVGLTLILAAIRTKLFDQLIVYAPKQKGRRPLTYKESVLLPIQHLKR